MAKRFLGGAGHVSNVYGAGQAAWTVALALWGAVVVVSTWAFSTVHAVMDQGYGAVVLAGMAAGSAVAMALAVLMFGLAAIAYGFRRLWPASAVTTPPASTPPAQPAPSIPDAPAPAPSPAAVQAPTPFAGPPMFYNRLANLPVKPASTEDRVAALETRQDAADAAIKAGIAEAKRHGENAAAGTGASLAEGSRDLRRALEGVASRLDAVEKRSGGLEAGLDAQRSALATLVQIQGAANLLAAVDYALALAGDYADGAGTITDAADADEKRRRYNACASMILERFGGLAGFETLIDNVKDGVAAADDALKELAPADIPAGLHFTDYRPYLVARKQAEHAIHYLRSRRPKFLQNYARQLPLTGTLAQGLRRRDPSSPA